MKEEIADKLMEKALAYLSSAEAFVGENVPKFIEELLSFKIFEHLLGYFDHAIPWSIFGLFVILAARWTLNRMETDRDFCDKNDINDITEAREIVIVVGFILLIPVFISLSHTSHLVQAYKAYKAPRVYLVDYFKGQK